jgi:hypothetical protein
LGVSRQNFKELGGGADLLWPFIWIRQRNGIKICADLGKSATEIVAMIRQMLGEENMSRTGVFEWHAQFRADRKRLGR